MREGEVQPTSPFETFDVHTLAERLLSPEPVKLPDSRRESRPLMSPEELDEFSRGFFQALIERHANWRGRAQVLSGDECDGALLIEVPAPNRMPDLWISTEYGQVTVGFGALYHTHFVVYQAKSETFAAALDFIDGFIDEDIVLVVASRDGWVAMSWTQCSREDVLQPAAVAASVPPPESLQVLSWRATHDRHITTD